MTSSPFSSSAAPSSFPHLRPGTRTDSSHSSDTTASSSSSVFSPSPFNRSDTDTSLESAASFSTHHSKHKPGLALGASAAIAPSTVNVPNDLLFALSHELLVSYSSEAQAGSPAAKHPLPATEVSENSVSYAFVAQASPSMATPSSPSTPAPSPFHDHSFDDSSAAGSPAAWRVEFRGVVKLVRWVSGKKPSSSKRGAAPTSPRITLSSHHLDNEPTTDSSSRPRFSRVPTGWGRTKRPVSEPTLPSSTPPKHLVKRWAQSQLTGRQTVDQSVGPILVRKSESGTSTHGELRVVSEHIAPDLDVQVASNLVASATESDTVFYQSPPSLRRKSVLSKAPPPPRRPSSAGGGSGGVQMTTRNMSLPVPPQHPFQIASPSATRSATSLSVSARVKRTFSVSGCIPSASEAEMMFPSSMSDCGHGNGAGTEWEWSGVESGPSSRSLSVVVNDKKPRPRKLVKPPDSSSSSRASIAREPPAMSRGRQSWVSQTSDQSQFSSTSSVSTTHRKLSKRNIPSSAYSSMHLTEQRPTFLASLPEIQPVGSMGLQSRQWNHSPERQPTTRPMFLVGHEDDDEEVRYPWSSTSTSDVGPSTSTPPSSYNGPHTRQLRHSTSSHKRWTVAVSEIPDDEDFLKELDRQLELGGASSIGMHEQDTSAEDGAMSVGGVGRRWDGARRAMLCVREIVRTERSYQDHLVRANEIERLQIIAPAVLCEHLPLLIAASQKLTTFMEDDPSAWGVAAAFLNAVDDLETVLVAWCAVVGDIITDSPSSPPSSGFLKRNNSGPIYSSITRDKAARRSGAVSDDGHGPSPPSSAKRTSQGFPWRRGSLPSPISTSALPTILLNGAPNATSKALSLQDIAIMPIQRVGRYVMLYRELLKHTPASSPSYPLVERALQGALRIARASNHAQQNTTLQKRS